MRFILAPDAIEKFENLRANYQKERNIDLSVQPSTLGVPTFFGGTNVPARREQIHFLEKMKVVLSANLLKTEDIKTPEQWVANITASKLMIAACLYVQNQIGSSKRNSALYRIIEDSLGVTYDNYFDDQDKEECYITADRLIRTTKMPLEEANKRIQEVNATREKKLNDISEKEWSEFTKFLHTNCNTSKPCNTYTTYPITSITKPLFGWVFASTGATIGYLGGDVISNSTKAMASRYQLTALVGSTLLVLGPAGPTGVALFAPVIAGKLITAFCSISLAQILGVAMGIIGQGVGIGVGMPLDFAYQLLLHTCALIGNYYCGENKTHTGLRLDGKIFLGGIQIEMLPESSLPKDYKKQSLEIKADGTMLIDGKLVSSSTTDIKLPIEMIQELESKLKAHLPKQENREGEEQIISELLQY